MIALLGIIFLTAFGGYQAARRMAGVAAVQDSLERDWEINFNDGGRPAGLPAWADRALQKWIRKVLGPEPDYHFLGQKPNRADVWCDRVRTLFRGRITEIEIWYPNRLRGDLGNALARFPSLRRVAIHDADFSEKEWSYVFAGCHRLPRLEELNIGGHTLRDATIEGLAGLRSIRKVFINAGELAEACPETFAQMPKLKELTIEQSALGTRDTDPPVSETQKMIREALPNVKVAFE